MNRCSRVFNALTGKMKPSVIVGGVKLVWSFNKIENTSVSSNVQGGKKEGGWDYANQGGLIQVNILRFGERKPQL